MDTQANQSNQDFQVNLYIRYPSKQWTKFVEKDKNGYQVDILLDEFIQLDIDNFEFISISFSRVNVSKDNKCGINYLYSYRIIQPDADRDNSNEPIQLIYGPSSYIAYINRLTDYDDY